MIGVYFLLLFISGIWWGYGYNVDEFEKPAISLRGGLVFLLLAVGFVPYLIFSCCDVEDSLITEKTMHLKSGRTYTFAIDGEKEVQFIITTKGGR